MTPEANRLVEAFADAGFPRMPAAALVAVLTSESSALTAAELATALDVSPAAVSGAVRYLQTVGMMTRQRVAGDRRYVYELPEHAWYAASVNNQALYERLASVAETTAASLDVPAARERVLDMAGFFRFVQRRIPDLLDEWNAQRR
ncbi:DNA-binding transcriptional regulator GbsR (MarR family) [Curtobacterium flaccumfaciens]|uniref:DNA-binding transcriptional regulator GbsR (MarR family) n=1 Tax=Curtobacterium flaccumfaciens TaxID=2035 RepID=A0A4R6DKI2_9MICO|nr:MarR family transcriptional regulator [Curtobacterium flaccumfaciens]TDN45356.1 DNA-binding transcriptional regulator GbsR (MarR family) [Curtobacterium flaccumfaciens]